jgi:hypothetical protein
MADPACVLTVIKRFPYKTNPAEEWSNQYAFSGSTPPDPAGWRALFDALVAAEKLLYTARVQVIGGYGYDKVPKKGDSAIWALDLTVAPNSVVPGTLALSSNQPGGGDAALWVRWGLDRLNSHGKRIYLRKYFHDVYVAANATPDVPNATQLAALNAFGTKLRDGSFLASRTIVSPPDKNGNHGGMVPISSMASPYITTRTLKRRGKRPPT